MSDYDDKLKVLQIEKLKLDIETVKKDKEVGKPWNSLEKAKLFVSLLLPILLIIITYKTNSTLHSIEQNQKEAQNKEEKIFRQNQLLIENNKRIYEHRFFIYQNISLRINEIYSYIYYIGKWKELSPERILQNKRYCDEIMYSNQSLFSPVFFETYRRFMDIAFSTYNGEGENAKLCTELYSHKKYYYNAIMWNRKWDKMFLFKNNSDEAQVRQGIHECYNQLLTLLTKELNVIEVKVDNPFKDFKPG